MDISPNLVLVELPLDVLTEIFSHLKRRYSDFRSLCTSTNKAKLLWDGWDALIDQGISVKINSHKIVWFKNGVKHRDNDLPSVVWTSGEKEWFVYGLCHRDPEKDLPAVEYPDGSRTWFVNGLLHREGDLPAIEWRIKKVWCILGKLHRDNDLPAIERADGTKEWYQNGELHREGHLPAVISFDRSVVEWSRNNIIYDRLIISDRDVLENISRENGNYTISSK